MISSQSFFFAFSALVLLLSIPTYTIAACTTELTVCDGGGPKYRPLPNCRQYVECANGIILSKLSCASGSIYDIILERCNWDYVSFCNVETCAPTEMPTTSPSDSPSSTPSAMPSGSPTITDSISPSASPSSSPTDSDFFAGLETQDMKQKIESTVLQSYTPTGGIAYPSTKYLYDGLISSLKEMAIDGIQSDGREFKFWIGSDERRKDYGRTNVAAFLAMAMTETIAYDTCDEFNSDEVAGRYAISNSCGQNSRSYQDEVCTNSQEVDMSCPVDMNMNVVSSGYSTNVMGRAPPPFSCKPKEDEMDYAGYWDSVTGASSLTAYSNALGRTDLEGCCWWGRGALLTRGVCNIGKLNYYLGRRASVERGEGRFPAIDFCAFREATCATEIGQENAEGLLWITGMFEWIERIQSYPNWDYINNLKRFVDGGMVDEAFIDTVSSIFTRDCHFPNCSALEITKREQRKTNFYRVLQMFGLPQATPPPTMHPTPSPTTPEPTTPSPIKSILPPSLYKPPLPTMPPIPIEVAPSEESTAWMRPQVTPTLVQQPIMPVTQQFTPVNPATPSQPINPIPTTVSRPTNSEELIPIEDNLASFVVISRWSRRLLIISVAYHIVF